MPFTARALCMHVILSYQEVPCACTLYYLTKRGLVAVVIHQPQPIVSKAFDFLLKACNVVIVDDDVHPLGFFHPCFVLEIQPS